MYAPLSRNVFWIYGALQIKIIIIIIIKTLLQRLHIKSFCNFVCILQVTDYLTLIYVNHNYTF